MEDAPNPPKKATPRTRRATPAAAAAQATPRTRPTRSQVTARADSAPTPEKTSPRAPVKRKPTKTITEAIAPAKPAKQTKQTKQTKAAVAVAPVLTGDPFTSESVNKGTLLNLTPAASHTPMWAHLVADPGYVPEHVAREAVRRLGPEARDWVQRLGSRYPSAGPDALARLATMELTRAGRRQGAGSGIGGAAGSWVAVGLLARTQARLVLTLAAVYGLDPTSADRSRDLLDLQRVPRLTQPTTTAVVNGARLLAAVAVRRIAARLMPFGAAVAGSVHSGRQLEELARRASERFRIKNS